MKKLLARNKMSKISKGMRNNMRMRCEKAKREVVMEEFRRKKLHSGSKKGPLVKNPKQAVAIAYSVAKKHCLW